VEPAGLGLQHRPLGAEGIAEERSPFVVFGPVGWLRVEEGREDVEPPNIYTTRGIKG